MSEVIERAIFLRGLFLHRYAGVEASLAQLLVCARMNAVYASLPILSAHHQGRLKQLENLMEIPGPIADSGVDLLAAYKELQTYENYRVMMAHALMAIGRRHAAGCGVSFRMYRKRGDDVETGWLVFA